MFMLLALWLACSSAPSPPAEPSIALPGPFAALPLPTSGAEIQEEQGRELVLNYPGGEVRPLVESYVSALDDAGWALEQPQSGGRFIRVEAHKDGQTLEFFVVKQPDRAEVHLELGAPP